MLYRTWPLASAVFMSLILSACATTDKPVPPDENNPEFTEGPIASGQTRQLKICKMAVKNPPSNENRLIKRVSASACAQGVELLVAPAPDACLTSGFGHRNGRLHKGIDYQSKPSGPVVAAGNGTVLIKQWRQKDFGNWIVIDHGKGVYTSYGHLANVENGIKPGKIVSQGTKLGIMGKTGNATSSIHLHVEYRVGDITNPKGYFGLTPINPFQLPESCPAS